MRNDIVGLAQQYAQEKAQTAAKRIRDSGGVRARRRGILSYCGDCALRRAILLDDVALWADNRRSGRGGGRLGPRAHRAVAAGRRRRPAPPPPAPNPPQFASLLAQTAPALALKRPLLSALVLAVALGMVARGSIIREKVAPRGPNPIDDSDRAASSLLRASLVRRDHDIVILSRNDGCEFIVS